MNTFLNRKEIEFVFVDWFGVLSTNFYWCVQSSTNPNLKTWCDSVFKNPQKLNDWMRGKYELHQLTSSDFAIEQILELFEKDKDYYSPDWELLSAIQKLFPSSIKILITDNMPLFTEKIISWYPKLKKYFKYLFISSSHGALKKDSPISLFDIALKQLNKTDFKNCLLIDDDLQNCEKFKEMGGRVIYIG